MHHWCGHTLRSEKYEELAWFFEGFSEYMANMVLVRQALIPADDFLKLAAIHLAQYEYFFASPLFSNVTLRAAGTRKTSYRFGVYSGGWAVAFVMDQELRKQGKTLEDFLRALLARADRKKLTIESFLETLADVGGLGLMQKIHDGISKREAMPVDDYLAPIGIGAVGQSYAAEKFLYRLPAETARDARRKSWAGF